jgi:hypothetical protein
MSKFFTNSASTLAIRIDTVRKVFIKEKAGKFLVVVKTSMDETELESADTLVAAQAAAAPLMAALEV